MPTTHTPLDHIKLTIPLNILLLSTPSTVSASRSIKVLEALLSFTFVSAYIRPVYALLSTLPY